VVEVDGPNDRTLVGGLDPGSDIVQDIEWSPDGSALLYEVSRSTADGLPIGETFVVGIEGAPPQRLVRSERDLPFAGWSPDGRTAAFARTDEGGVDLRLIDADGRNDRLLTRFEGENRSLMLHATGSGPGNGPAGWSPDGTKIAAVLNGTDVYVVEVSSGEATFVATNASYCLMAFLGWSPDGETIYVIPQCAPGGL
jgi:Tol biopolymer transport system component